MIKKCCALTGHRELGEDFDGELLENCIRKLVKKGVERFLCGMARGFDLAAGKAVLKVAEEFENVELVACIPCPEQDKFYGEKDRETYLEIYGKCSEIKILNAKYYKGCMLARDRYMVDNSDCVLAYMKEQRGGTYYTVKYAYSKGKEIYFVEA